MKTKNFPERKRQRQIKALNQVQKTMNEKRTEELKVLTTAVAAGTQREKRTKKNRSGERKTNVK